MRPRTYTLSLLVFTLCITPSLAQWPTLAQNGEEDEPVAEETLTTYAEGHAEGVTEQSEEPAPYDLATTDRLTGDWFGARSWLEQRGIDFGVSMTAIYQHNAHGGLQTHGGHRITGSVDWELTLDTEGLGLWPGGTLFAAAESSWNDGIGGDRVGNLFGVNTDAAGDRAILVAELWYEHVFWEGKARFRAGKMDVGVDFDTNAYANDETAQFLNPALVNTGNIPMPDLGLGVQLLIEPLDWLYVGIVAADAQADGRETGLRTAFHDEDHFFVALEIGFLPLWQTAGGNLPGGYRFGIWYDPQPKDRFFNDLGGRLTIVPRKRDDMGFYFNMDQMLFKEKPQDDSDTQGMGMFCRYGFAHDDVNEVEHFWSIGVQYQGLIPTRDDDVVAFGVAQGILSDRMALQGDTPHQETVLELYYSMQITPWLALTPDLQWILDPGGMGTGRDSVVAGLRAQISF